MEIVTCKNCGRLFNYMRGNKLCPVCMKKIEDKFIEVKKYVRENPNVDIQDLSETMEVSVRQINQWIREERLVFSDDSPIGLPCESCGVTIKTGRFCQNCKSTLATDFRNAAASTNQKSVWKPRTQADKNRMRFLDSSGQ